MTEESTPETRAEGTRVLFVQRKLPPYRIALFNALARVPSIDLTLAIFSKPDVTDSINFKVIERESLKKGGLWWAPGLRELALNFDSVIIPFDIHEVGCLMLLLDSSLAEKAILFGHSHGRRKNLRFLRRMLISRASATVVYTKKGKSRLVAEGVDDHKVFVANNSIAVENAGLDATVERSSFLFVGRLTERKRVCDLIQAFALARSNLPDSTTIDIVGDGEQRASLESLVQQNELSERVRFHGQILSDDRLKELFSKAIAYVSPGHVGLGVIHSFAYGIPVVTTEHDRHAPEYSHLRKNENGIVYNGRIEALREVLESFFRQPALSRQLGSNAYKHFQTDLQLSNTVEGFQQAIMYSLRQRQRHDNRA